MEHYDGVVLFEVVAGEAVKDDGGGGGGVVEEGEVVDGVGIDEVCDCGARGEDAGAEDGGEEVVGLVEEAVLPRGLCGEDGAGTASEAAVVDACDAVLVVREFVGNGEGCCCSCCEFGFLWCGFGGLDDGAREGSC